MQHLRRSKLLCNIVSLRRSVHTGRPDMISEKAFQKFKLKQAKMQCEDVYPVYLKRGTRDKILYGTTLGLIFFNSCQIFRIIYRELRS